MFLLFLFLLNILYLKKLIFLRSVVFLILESTASSSSFFVDLVGWVDFYLAPNATRRCRNVAFGRR